MSVEKLESSGDLDKAIKSGVSLIWIYDSDGANQGFGKQLNKVAGDNSNVTFYKAGDQDIKDAIKSHGLDVDWCFLFKDGEKIGNHREDHNAVHELIQKNL